jgi:hypothetical protein
MNKKFVYWSLISLMGFLTLVGCTRIRGGGQDPLTVPQSQTQSTAQPAVQENDVQPTQAVDLPEKSASLQPQTPVVAAPTAEAASPAQKPAPTTVQQETGANPVLDKSADDLDNSLDNILNQLDSSDKLGDVK